MQVHAVQAERMRARSDWFLSDPSGLVNQPHRHHHHFCCHPPLLPSPPLQQNEFFYTKNPKYLLNQLPTYVGDLPLARSPRRFPAPDQPRPSGKSAPQTPDDEHCDWFYRLVTVTVPHIQQQLSSGTMEPGGVSGKPPDGQQVG